VIIPSVFLIVNKDRHGQLARQLGGRAGAGGAEINMQEPVNDSCTTHERKIPSETLRDVFQFFCLNPFHSMYALMTCHKRYAYNI
jgi:hypothetical protein